MILTRNTDFVNMVGYIKTLIYNHPQISGGGFGLDLLINHLDGATGCSFGDGICWFRAGERPIRLKGCVKKKGGFGFGFALRRSQSVREKQSDGSFQAGQYFTRPVSNGCSGFDF